MPHLALSVSVNLSAVLNTTTFRSNVLRRPRLQPRLHVIYTHNFCLEEPEQLQNSRPLYLHSCNTRAASCGKYHVQFSRLNQQRNSFSCFGAKAWNCLPSQVCNLPKLAFKKSIRKALFAALAFDDCILFIVYSLKLTNWYILLIFFSLHNSPRLALAICELYMFFFVVKY